MYVQCASVYKCFISLYRLAIYNWFLCCDSLIGFHKFRNIIFPLLFAGRNVYMRLSSKKFVSSLFLVFVCHFVVSISLLKAPDLFFLWFICSLSRLSVRIIKIRLLRYRGNNNRPRKRRRRSEREKNNRKRVYIRNLQIQKKKIFIYNVKMELGTEWDKAKCHKPKWASYTYIGLNMWLSRGGERHRLRQSRVGEWVSSLRFCVSFQLRVYWPSFGDLNEI